MKIWSDFGASGRVRAHFLGIDQVDGPGQNSEILQSKHSVFFAFRRRGAIAFLSINESLTVRHIIFLSLGLMASATTASAQSVLERVLGQIDGASNLAQVNGVYANIAESVLLSKAQSRDILSNVASDFSAASPGDIVATITDSNGKSYDLLRSDFPVSGSATLPVWYTGLTDHLNLFADGRVQAFDGNWSQGDTYSLFGVNGVLLGQFNDTDPPLTNALVYVEAVTSTEVYQTPIATTIDGSITNIITGVTSATQEALAGAASATEFNLPTFDLGDMTTTALGAVNTGEITLGVNSAVDEAKTSSTRAISAVMTQIGGSADTGALVLNVASNASAVNGSIENVMMAVNGSIGSASTTALGAVNTGTITSGVNSAVQGIVGLSGQSASGL